MNDRINLMRGQFAPNDQLDLSTLLLDLQIQDDDLLPGPGDYPDESVRPTEEVAYTRSLKSSKVSKVVHKGWWYRLPGVGHSKASYESDSIFHLLETYLVYMTMQ